MLRIKAFLLLERDTTRDYLDTVVLLEHLGDPPALDALRTFDATYPQTPSRGPALAELVERLARAHPTDRQAVELSSYKGVVPPWTSWPHLEGRGRHWAARLARALLGGAGTTAMPDPMEILARSRALWNRSRLDLRSDETLAQILDRGSVEDWRALYAIMAGVGADAEDLRQRVHAVLFRVPTGYPWLWLAALASLGVRVDWSKPPRVDPGVAAI
jgi:hypothetical protein